MADPFTAVDGYESTDNTFIEIQSCFNRKFICLIRVKVAVQLARGLNFFIIDKKLQTHHESEIGSLLPDSANTEIYNLSSPKCSSNMHSLLVFRKVSSYVSTKQK